MEAISMFAMLALAVIVYFLPLIIASQRKHPSAIAIAALNLLAGWTLLGWLFALVWSLSAIVASPPLNERNPESSVNGLYKLAELKEKGLLTHEEFEKEKMKLLNTSIQPRN